MKQFVFVLKNAWLGITSQKLLSTVVIIAVTIGLIFPVAIIAQINNYYCNYAMSYYNDIEHTAVLEYSGTATTEEEMTELIRSWSDDVKNCGFFATYMAVLKQGDLAYVSQVSGYSPEYMNIGKTVLVNGRFPTEEEMKSGANVCLVISPKTKNENVKVGDVINIAGKNFNVIGIVRDTKSYGSVFVPYNSLLKIAEGVPLQCKAYIQTEGAVKVNKIKLSDVGIINKQTALAAQAEFRDWAIKGIKQRMLICLIATLFSVISFTLIIVGKVLNEQYVLGVKTAMGATKGQLFWDLAVQNFVLIQISAIASITIIASLSALVPGIKTQCLFGGVVVIITELLCVVMTLIITTVAMLPILRKPVTELFRSAK